MIRSRLILFSILLASTACKTMGKRHEPVAQVVDSYKKPVDLSLKLKDGRQLEMWRASIVGDSVVGDSHKKYDAFLNSRVAVAQADVATVSAPRMSSFLSVLLALLATYATIFLILMITNGLSG
jgi:hypothetical protein